jgi:1-phosphofructokinase
VIVTVTPNPSLDLTYVLEGDLGSGALLDVHRATVSTLEASGKGVNVSRALQRAGVRTLAVLPVGGPTGRHVLELLEADEVAVRPVPVGADTRVNTTVVHGGGTTKVNAPGALTQAEGEALVRATGEAVAEAVTRHGRSSVWLAVCGSLARGTSPDLVTALVGRAHAAGVRSVVDSSGHALTAAVGSAASVLAPNVGELADVDRPVGDAAQRGLEALAGAAREVSARTGCQILLSLGEDGALWTDGGSVRHAATPVITPVNTAGAGDALLAGWLAAEWAPPPDDFGYDLPDRRLATAVAWGRAACLSPTTVGPYVASRELDRVVVRHLTWAAPAGAAGVGGSVDRPVPGGDRR